METYFKVFSVFMILLSSLAIICDKIDIEIYAAISAIYFLLLSKEEK